jgi:hypothetical protein
MSDRQPGDECPDMVLSAAEPRVPARPTAGSMLNIPIYSVPSGSKLAFWAITHEFNTGQPVSARGSAGANL